MQRADHPQGRAVPEVPGREVPGHRASYIQHTCFQDESAKQQVSSRGPGGSLSLPQAGRGHLLLAPRPPARLPKAVSVPGTAQSRGNVCGGDATQPLVVEETLE